MLKAKTTDMRKKDYDYLIIGNSAAGVTAAEAIRKHDKAGTIAIIGEEPYPVYGRPLISYLVEGNTTMEKIGFKPEDFYEVNSIDAYLGSDHKAVKMDADRHTVYLSDGSEIKYGKCLIATGSKPFVPPIPGLDEADNVFRFITLDDALSSWKATDKADSDAHDVGRSSRVVVIGSGLIGLKAAEALSYHADEVVVLELAPRILPAVLDDEGSSILKDLLSERGIRCLPGISAAKVIVEDGHATAVELTDGNVLDCDIVVAAVGVRPNSSIAVDAGAAEGRGLICNERLETTLPDVYAAGDVTQVKDALDGSEHPLALWPNAIKQGKIAGQQMSGAPDAAVFTGDFAVNAVDFFDISLLTSGMINPPAEKGFEEKVIIEDDKYAKFVIEDDRLVGYILMNRPKNAGIYTSLIENKVPLSQLSEEIFNSAPLNLDFDQEVRWARLHKAYPEDLDQKGWRR